MFSCYSLHFWTHKLMTPKMTKNDPKISFSKSPNHIKLSVDVRNDVYNIFQVFLENIFIFWQSK